MFDRVAKWVAAQISKPWFFCFCVLLVLVWAPSYFLIGDIDTWQLIINTVTTIVTFLMVALLQNSQQQAEDKMIKQNKDIMTRLDCLHQLSAYTNARVNEIDHRLRDR